MHEVDRPRGIDAIRHGQRFRFLAYQPFAWLNPQIQFQLAIDAVHALVVPAKAFHVAQIQEAQAKTPVALVVCQTNEPIGNFRVFGIKLWPVAIARLADAECRAYQSDANPALLDRLNRHLAPARWLHHFFSKASLTISALSFSSAYIFLRRRFSSSSSLSRAISDASIPPNLDRHL